jgi:isocitrate dehydrogenase kinase/phosphatase
MKGFWALGGGRFCGGHVRLRAQSDFKKWHLVLDFRPSEKRFLIAPTNRQLIRGPVMLVFLLSHFSLVRRGRKTSFATRPPLTT